MSQMTAKERDELRSSQFAYVDPDGGEHLPINDEAHVRNAIARFSQTDFHSTSAQEDARKKILRAADRHGIDVGEESAVSKPPR